MTIGRRMNVGFGKKRLTFIKCRDSSDAHEETLSASL